MGLVRFLLAMAVVVAHIAAIWDFTLIPGTLFTLIPGGLAVEVFFSISGFYMSLILTGKYRDRMTFYINRFLRLYPVFLIVTLATWAWFLFAWIYMGKLPNSSWIDAYKEMSWAQALSLMISNWTMVGQDIPSLFHFRADAGFLLFHSPQAANAPDGAKWAGEFRTIPQAWSIGAEIWFYLMAPFLVALRSRWIVLITVVSIALKIIMTKLGLVTYFFVPAQLCFFLVGMLLHRAYVTFSLEKLDRRIGYGVLIAVTALFVFFDRLSEPIANYVIYAAFIPAIPILFTLTRKNRFDIELGNLSYPIYMVHALILGMASNMLHHANIDMNMMIALVLIIAVIVVSIILHLVIEKPVDEIRQRLAVAPRPHSPNRALIPEG